MTVDAAVTGCCEVAESQTPVLGVAVPYAIANIVLTVLGPIIVGVTYVALTVCEPVPSDRLFKARAPFRSETCGDFRRAIDFAGFRHAIHEFARALACVGRRCCGRRCRRQIASVRSGLRSGRLRSVLGVGPGSKEAGAWVRLDETSHLMMRTRKGEEEQQLNIAVSFSQLISRGTVRLICVRYHRRSHNADADVTIAGRHLTPIILRRSATQPYARYCRDCTPSFARRVPPCAGPRSFS